MSVTPECPWCGSNFKNIKNLNVHTHEHYKLPADGYVSVEASTKEECLLLYHEVTGRKRVNPIDEAIR